MTNIQPEVRISSEALRRFAEAVFVGLGTPRARAERVAAALVSANLRGVDSHGVALLNWYANCMQRGLIDVHAEPTVISESLGHVVVDANNGLGAPTAVYAMDKCLELARGNGIAGVTVRNGNHFGMAGHYARRALPHDMIGMAMTTASRLVTPTFGVEPMLGTNPIAVAAPAGTQPAFVLDMATSVQPFGKVLLALHNCEQLPTGIATDAQGNPVLDPETFITGVREDFSTALLPLGSFAELAGYKGYGLALLVDILSGVLSGSNFGKYVAADPDAPANIGHWFMAINIATFMPVDEFKERLDSVLQELKASRNAPGEKRIYAPCEIEFETQAERSEHGIPLPAIIIDQLSALAEEFAIEFDLETML